MAQIKNHLSDGNYFTSITPRGLAHPLDSPETNVDTLPSPLDTVVFPGLLGSDLSKRTPPGTIGSYEKLVAQERKNIERLKKTLPAQARNEMFEKGLSGEVDLNTVFGGLTTSGTLELIPAQQYALLKEAKAAETAGNASPDQVAALNSARDPSGELRMRYDTFAQLSGDPRFAGFIESGGFPLKPDGDVILPKETEMKYITGPINDITGELEQPLMGPINNALYYLGLGTRANIEDQAQGQARIREFIVNRLDGPADADARDALLQTLGTDFADIFAERIYNLMSVSELGAFHYLPSLSKTAYRYAYRNSFLEGAFGEIYVPTDAEIANELAEFKKNQLFSNRMTFVNDMIREQLFVLYGEEKFERLGLGEKNEDGQFVRQFVGEKFAEDLFEAMWDDLHWTQKLGGYMLEGAIALKTIMAPGVLTGRILRTGNRLYRHMHNMEIPYHLLPTNTLRAMGAAKAGTDLALDVTTKTREMLKNAESYRFFSNFRINRLARAVGREQTKVNVQADRANYGKQIVTRQNEFNDAGDRVADIRVKIAQAEKTGDPDGTLDDLRSTLRIAKENLQVADDNLRFVRAKRNNAIIRSWGIKVRESGFHPEFDGMFALAMLTGRNMLTGPRDPETGFPLEPQRALLGEGGAAIGMVGLLSVNQLFKLEGVSKRAFGVAGQRAPNIAFRVRTFFEENIMSPVGNGATGLFRIYRRGIGEGWLVNPSVKNIVFADAATRAQLTVGEQKQIQKFAATILSMPPEYQEPVFRSLDIFFQDTQTVMGVLEPLVAAGVMSMQELSEYRKLLSAGFGETSSLAVLKAYKDMYLIHAGQLKPGEMMNMKSRVLSLLADTEHYKKRQGVLSNIAARLDEKSLKLEKLIGANVEDTTAARQAIDILKAYSLSLTSSAEYHRLGYVNSIEGVMEEIDAHIKYLAESELPSLQELASVEGILDDLLVASARLESLKSGVETPKTMTPAARANMLAGARADLPGGPATQEQIYESLKEEVGTLSQVGPPEAANTIRNKVDNLMSGMTRVISHTNLSSTEQSRLIQLDNTLKGLVAVADSGRFAEVTLAYDKVSNIRTIPLTSLTDNLMKFLELELRVEGGAPSSFIKDLTPARFDDNFGKIGTEFLSGIEKAARKGLLTYFSDPSRLQRLSEVRGKEIGSAEEAITELKDLAASYGFAREALGTDDQAVLRNMSDLQLSLILIRDNFAEGVDAAALNLIASPKELEEFRRLAFRLKGDDDRKVKNLGSSIVSQIDSLLEAHLQLFEGEQLNAIITARVKHRGAMQRFDPGTFGYDVQQLQADARKRLTGEGLKTGEKRVDASESDLLKPMISAILDPQLENISIIGETIERLQATLSPIRPTGDLVIRGADGKARIPTSEELDTLVTRDMSPETFNVISSVIRVAVRNKLNKLYKADDMRRAMKLGVLPDLNLNKSADEIVVPSKFKSLDEYFDFINDELRVSVNGEMQLLFDVRDVYYANRDVGDLINGSSEYREAHAELVQKILKAAASDEKTGKKALELSKERSKTILKYSENASTGQGFFSNVINSDDSAAMEKFLVNLEADQSMNPEQKQAALRSLFIQVMKEVGGHSTGTATVKLPDGRQVSTDSYTRPGELFFLFDDALNVTGSQITGVNFLRLAEAAGISMETLEAYRAVFRLGFRESAPSMVQQRTTGTLDFEGSVKPGIAIPRGYSVDNAIARAFNLARKMVSMEYVMAEAFVKYAAVAKGKTLQFLIDDPQAAEIMHALLTESRKVVEEDARYFVEKLLKVSAREIKPYVDGYDPESEAAQRAYWESRGFVFDQPLSAFPYIPNVFSPAGGAGAFQPVI